MTNALPTITVDQRTEGLSQAHAIRRARARIKADLLAGATTLTDVFADESAAAQGARIGGLLRAHRGIGPATAHRLMDKARIPNDKRVRALGVRQRRAIVAAMKELGRDA